MLFRSSLLHAFIAISLPAAVSGNWFGFGDRGDATSDSSGSSAPDSTGFYSPSAEFYVHANGKRLYLPNREDSFSFLFAENTRERICTTGLCDCGEYCSSSVHGREIENGFTFTLATEGFSSFAVGCPFGKMNGTVLADAYCASTPETSIFENITYTSDAVLLHSFSNIGPSCPVPEGADDEYIVLDIVCTANDPQDFSKMKSAVASRRANSFGSEYQYPTRNKIGVMYTSSSDDASFCWVDGMTTFLEYFAHDEKDAGYCTTSACVGDYTSAYVHSADPNKFVLYSNDDFSSVEILCPYGDQIPSAKLVGCDSADTTLAVTADIVGPYIVHINENCTSAVMSIEVECKDPVAASEVQESSSTFSAARWFGRHDDDNQDTPSETDAQKYTPSGEFYVYVGDSEHGYLPNRGDSFTYLNGDTTGYTLCTVGTCYGDYMVASVLGREIDNGFTFSIAPESEMDLVVACPYGNMDPTVTNAYCANTPEISVLENVTWTAEGIILDKVSHSNDCPVPEDLDNVYTVFDIACTANATSEFPAMQAAFADRENIAVGNDKKVATRNIPGFITEESTTYDAIWVNGLSTTIEMFGVDEGDDGYCTTTGCRGEYYSGYVHSPDPNKFVLYSNDDFDYIHVFCPYGDQTPSVKLVDCKDAKDKNIVATAEIVGPIILGISENCTSPYVGVEIECKDP